MAGIAISGATTVAEKDGVAAFTSTRMRAPEGPRLLTLNATLARPVRSISGPQVLVYVRPCVVGTSWLETPLAQPHA